MNKQQIVDTMFNTDINNDYTYASDKALEMYKKGVSYKDLSLYKWEFVLECKRQDNSKLTPVFNLFGLCGYCFESTKDSIKSLNCRSCTLNLSQANCCNDLIKESSCEMSLKNIERMIKYITEANKIA